MKKKTEERLSRLLGLVIVAAIVLMGVRISKLNKKIRVLNDSPENYTIAIKEDGEEFYYSRYGRRCHQDEGSECTDWNEETQCDGICITFRGCQEWSCLNEND